jgi:hypothetical protein
MISRTDLASATRDRTRGARLSAPDGRPSQGKTLTMPAARLDQRTMPDGPASRLTSDSPLLSQSALPLLLMPADASPHLHLSLLLAPLPAVVAEVAGACV